MKAAWLLVGCLLVAALLTASCAPGATEEKPAPPEERETPPVTESGTVSVTAAQLFVSFDDNETAADAQYEGKVLNVSGVVTSIGIVEIGIRQPEVDEAILGQPLVVLTDGRGRRNWRVHCVFDREDQSQLAGLTEGEEATITGDYSSCRYPPGPGFILLRKCRLTD